MKIEIKNRVVSAALIAAMLAGSVPSVYATGNSIMQKQVLVANPGETTDPVDATGDAEQELLPPSNLDVTATEDGFSLSWTNSESKDIDGYLVMVGTSNSESYLKDYKSSQGITTKNTSCEVLHYDGDNELAFQAGKTYYFRVYAAKDGKYSKTFVSANEKFVATVKKPGKPTSLEAKPSAEKVELTWKAPDDGGSKLKGYLVEISKDSKKTWQDYSTSQGITTTKTSCTVTGLDTGKTYYFRVSACNEEKGFGDTSDEISAKTTSASAPSVPRSLSASAGDKKVSLSWSKPSDTGGGTFSGYLVQYKTSSGSWKDYDTNTKGITTTSLSYNVTGLSNGTKYYFRVFAINTEGTSSASSEVNATPSATAIPSAPRSLTATAGNKRVSLSWTKPSSGTVTGYMVQYRTSSGSWKDYDTNSKDITTTSTSYTVSDLSNDTKYYFRVYALNDEGKSSASDEASATPSTSGTLGKVTELEALPGSKKVQLTWTKPSESGSSTVTGYLVQYSTDDSSWKDYDASKGISTKETICTVTGLTNNTKYYFRVFAVNAQGNGDASAEKSAKPSSDYADYDLKFNTDGGSRIDTLTRVENTSVSLADYKPTKSGYTFEGWYTESSYSNKVTSIKLTTDKTVYAKWSETNKTPEKRQPKLNKSKHIAYISGYEDGTVRPKGKITREEAAQMFYRLLDADTLSAYQTTTNSFSDVSSDHWSNTAVSTLANAGILKGSSDGKFNPKSNVTRAELAAMLTRFETVAGTGGATFTDIDGHWARDSILVAANSGWVNGYEDGSFKPNASVTRAEAMKMINKVLGYNATENGTKDSKKTFKDNKKSDWYYYDVLSATNE